MLNNIGKLHLKCVTAAQQYRKTRKEVEEEFRASTSKSFNIIVQNWMSCVSFAESKGKFDELVFRSHEGIE